MWQKAVLSIEFCVWCGKRGVQWAHRNEGKGMGMKTSPDQTAALCVDCHHELDNGKHLSLYERRSMMDECITRTHRLLRARGRYPTQEKENE